MPIDNDNDLFNQLLGTGRDGGGADLNKIPDRKKLDDYRDRRTVVAETMGLEILPEDQLKKLVATGQSADPAKDDAYMRLLNKAKEVQQATVPVSIFNNLDDMASSLASVEKVTTDLALGLLQAVLDLDGENTRINRLVEELLAKPPETVLAPGLTVARLQVIFADVLKERQRQAALAENRSSRNKGHKKRLDKQTAQADQEQVQREGVARLRQHARDGIVLPPRKPLSRKDKGAKG